MAEECRMAEALMEAWKSFSLTTKKFQEVAETFAAELEAGLSGRPSSLQMLPAYVGKPGGHIAGTFLALDFGGTNVRVAEVQLLGQGRSVISKIHKVSLKNEAAGYDYTGPNTQVQDLFAFIAGRIGVVAGGSPYRLGHSFSYSSRQQSLGRANFAGWTKEIKVAGLCGQDINGLLAEELMRQNLTGVQPVAVLNDTTATLLAAAYQCSEADLGSVCGTGHNTCYYEIKPRHGKADQLMAYNAESGGFDCLPFSRFDDDLDQDSEYPGRQRLEKMVAGRYLGELARRILWAGQGNCGMSFLAACPVFCQPDGLTSIDVASFIGDETPELEHIGQWCHQRMANQPEGQTTLAERHFIKAVAELVVDRSATLIAASYAGFLRRMDPQRQQRHVIGINGSLYEKMPGFAGKIQSALALHGGWPQDQLSFLLVREAPLIGAAIAAAMTSREEP